jgi:hypothetical protein
MYEVFKVRCKLFVAYASLPPHFQTKKVQLNHGIIAAGFYAVKVG